MRKSKKKVNFLKLIIGLLLLYIVYSIIMSFFNTPIKNIFIDGENILTEQEIIDLAEIGDYEGFYTTFKISIKKRIEKSEFVEKVTIKKDILSKKISINVVEYKLLFLDDVADKVVLSNGEKIFVDIKDIPILINFVPEEKYQKLINEFILIDENVLRKISEIKYTPNEIDDNLFTLTMDDGNYVVVTLDYFKHMNSYLEIYATFEGKKGILYLDSGSYFEIKN